jgi:hypothetical protein
MSIHFMTDRSPRRTTPLRQVAGVLAATLASSAFVLALGPAQAAFAHTDEASGSPGTYDYRYPYPAMMTVQQSGDSSGKVATFTAGMPYVDPAQPALHPHQEVTAAYTLQRSPAPNRSHPVKWRDLDTQVTHQQLDRRETNGVPGSAFMPGATFDETVRDLGGNGPAIAHLYRIRVDLTWKDTETGTLLGVREALASKPGELVCSTGRAFMCVQTPVEVGNLTYAAVLVR